MTAAVSLSTEKRLRDAMQRLLTGQPARTDGRLTKANLYIEAGVSRATMNRATNVMTEWEAAVRFDTTPRSRQVAELEATVAELKKTVTRLRQSNTELERKNQAAVTVIAELAAQLTAFRGGEQGTVALLPARKVHSRKRSDLASRHGST
jgi:predicted RNase H-like nuclease (RuvC/YqgF family)